ncbi:MAG: ATP-grasp domain-containing protein [Phycisphaerales bacterium]
MSPDHPVLVLGGGPDAERAISITSATAVHVAAVQAGLNAELRIIDHPQQPEVDSWTGKTILPILHGRFGEGGDLQRMLQIAGLRFVGCQAPGARMAMDKMGTKLAAARMAVPVTPASIIDPSDVESPLDLPAVIKPVADGSSVGLHICETQAQWTDAIESVRLDQINNPHRAYMVEPMITGRELTASLLGNPDGSLRVLPLVEIAPASGVYDFDAKYQRNDTQYTVSPDLAEGMDERIRDLALRVGRALGVRHLARVDFILPEQGDPVLLELNTMPGFTPTSLLPMAALAEGMDMPALIKHLVQLAHSD